MMKRIVEIEPQDDAVWIYLNRPERHNALVPELVDGLRSAINEAQSLAPIALILAARGRSFSTGGDISGFLRHATEPEHLLAYSDRLVSGLHAAILDLLAFPAPVIAAAHGPVTGGATGLLLAADLVAMADDAFIQPYYCEVGFAPDGGWTALLPERVGTSRALEIQYGNLRINADEAKTLGLVNAAVPLDHLDRQVAGWLTAIRGKSILTHRATRANVWDGERLATARRRLDQEKAKFLDLVGRTETLEGMRTFSARQA